MRFLGAALGVSALIALGTALHVNGHRVVWLPWAAAAHVPLLNDALPFRFAVSASLAAGVMVALWTATTRGLLYPRPYVLPALAVAALVPAVWRTTYPTFEPVHPARPAFFADALYKSCVPRGETLAVFPFAGRLAPLAGRERVLVPARVERARTRCRSTRSRRRRSTPTRSSTS